MAVSEKQMMANRQNALKSTGPNTAQGKALAARNSLKHDLLAEEEGEGAEDKERFNALLADLVAQQCRVGRAHAVAGSGSKKSSSTPKTSFTRSMVMLSGSALQQRTV